MKTSTFLPWAMTFLFAFVIIHISAIFYIANSTELEDNKNPAFQSTTRIANQQLMNLNQVASQPLAIN